MIRIVLKESKASSNRNIRFLSSINGLRKEVEKSVRYGDVGSDEELWLAIINEIQPLKDSQIVSEIGAGMMGAAYELTNGNILKVGKEVTATAAAMPGQLSKDQFAGKGSASELHSYASGMIRSLHVSAGRWTWREVPKYIPFDDWAVARLTPTAGDSVDNSWEIERLSAQVGGLPYVIDDIIERFRLNFKREPTFAAVLGSIMKSYKNDVRLTLKMLGDKDTEKLIKASYNLIVKKARTSEQLDLHTGNLGVDQHGNFVYFDF